MSDMMFGAFFDNLPEMWPLFWQGILQTMRLAGGAVVVGLVFGFVVCLARMSTGLLRSAAIVYIEIMRGTPALVQLFLIYFGLVSVGIKFDAFEAAVLGLGLNMAAYVAEILRAGLQAVDRGQKEAAMAIGMTPAMSMRHIVLPQAIRIVLPPLGNSAISLIKDTSIAALISAPDLLLQARNLSSEYFMPLPIFLAAGVIYFCICFPLSLCLRLYARETGR
jgi:polar amino acid transport system permease protein